MYGEVGREQRRWTFWPEGQKIRSLRAASILNASHPVLCDTQGREAFASALNVGRRWTIIQLMPQRILTLLPGPYGSPCHNTQDEVCYHHRELFT